MSVFLEEEAMRPNSRVFAAHLFGHTHGWSKEARGKNSIIEEGYAAEYRSFCRAPLWSHLRVELRGARQKLHYCKPSSRNTEISVVFLEEGSAAE